MQCYLHASVEVDLKGIVWEGVNWIELAQDTEK